MGPRRPPRGRGRQVAPLRTSRSSPAACAGQRRRRHRVEEREVILEPGLTPAADAAGRAAVAERGRGRRSRTASPAARSARGHRSRRVPGTGCRTGSHEPARRPSTASAASEFRRGHRRLRHARPVPLPGTATISIRRGRRGRRSPLLNRLRQHAVVGSVVGVDRVEPAPEGRPGSRTVKTMRSPSGDHCGYSSTRCHRQATEVVPSWCTVQTSMLASRCRLVAHEDDVVAAWRPAGAEVPERRRAMRTRLTGPPRRSVT